VPSKVLVADVRHSACANATNATSAQATDVGSADAAHASAEATHVAGAKAAAHVTTAKATAATMSAATATATGLGTSSKQAAGEQRARQNHHYSSFHDILLSLMTFSFGWADCPPRVFSDAGIFRARRASTS
jgi:hypothetical protein